MVQVQIEKGRYRGEEVSGTFALVRPFNAEGAHGGFVTIRNPNPKNGHPAVQRIQVEQGQFKLLGADGAELATHVTVEKNDMGQAVMVSNYEEAFTSDETEEEAMQRIDETFLMLDRITDACARGIVRGLVVSGPPGIGKSFGVEKQLEAANMFRTLQNKEPRYEIISGGVSSIGLFQKLYFSRDKEHVIVFDDCDGVLFDEESILLLKGALNSGDRRRICWNKESRTLKSNDIPDVFDFHGSVVFLSNVDFEATIAKGSRIGAHLDAIMSRCHYMDMELGNMRDRLLVNKLRIRQGMLDSYDFTEEQKEAIWKFVEGNAQYLREISLRMTKKIADMVKADPANWLEMAEATTLQREARFKRLFEKRLETRTKDGVELIRRV